MTNVNLRSQEKAFLIENVKRLMDDIDYPSTSTFRHTTLMVVKSFARGRKMPFQPIIPDPLGSARAGGDTLENESGKCPRSRTGEADILKHDGAYYVSAKHALLPSPCMQLRAHAAGQ